MQLSISYRQDQLKIPDQFVVWSTFCHLSLKISYQQSEINIIASPHSTVHTQKW